ncbi:MAG: ATP-binding cassette domain-containing protein [Thermoanaerobaculia bacterium]
MFVRLGRISLLVGENGSGKTTLLDALTGRRPVADGHVYLDSIEMPRDAMRRRVAYVSQERPWLDELTVRDILAIARLLYPAFDLEFAESSIDGFGLTRQRRIGTCSAGEQRMIEHVIACSSGSEVVVLDETLAFLDSSRAETLSRIALEASTRSLILIATQDTGQTTWPADSDRYTMVRTGSTAKVLHHV